MSTSPSILLCWHAQRAGLAVLEQALKALRNRKVTIHHVIYLVQEGGVPEVPETVEGATVETVPLRLDDPTQHAAIYNLLKKQVLPRAHAIGGDLHINISPGTPAMHAVWLILHAGGAFPRNTTLWSSQFSKATQRTRIDPVDFQLTSYLAEIRHLQRIEPERAIYEPEAVSPARRAAFERLKRYTAVIGAPLLLLGERGIGKTRLVETHVAKLKSRSPVVTLACGGLDSSLAESLLFGHRKGAFTGAATDRPGILAQANGGILFLDEVQDLPKNVQRKLVRVFQDRQRRYRPLGSDKEESVDVELVCASNQPINALRELLDADLFDRLSHLSVRIPPLRECREDLQTDWKRVWLELRQRQDLPLDAPWTPSLATELSRHPLPGNIRDLQRLAVLIMAWWSDHTPDDAIERGLQEWSQWADTSAGAPPRLGEGNRKERLQWFRGELARWAKDVYGTWHAAGKALECDEKTLRGDAKLGEE